MNLSLFAPAKELVRRTR